MIDECYIHGEEPIPENCYLVCGECGHAYPTAEDLMAADRAEVERINAALLGCQAALDIVPWEPLVPHEHAEDITYCPLCSHDF